MLNQFCAKCGNPLDQNFFNEIHQFLCPKCYFKNNQILNIKNNYRMYTCKECNTYYFEKYSESEAFFLSNSNIIENIGTIIYKKILSQINLEDLFLSLDFDLESMQKSNNNFIFVEVKGELKKWKIVETKKIKIEFKHILCHNCANKKGKRYDSVIQLRIKKIKDIAIESVLEEIKNAINQLHEENPEFFISDIRKIGNGYDIFISKKALLRKIKVIIENKYPIIFKFSKKLIGKDPNTGGDLYRPYLLIKYFPIKVGDIIQKQNKKYIIKKVLSKSIYISELNSNKQIQKKLDFLDKKNIKIISK
ncbi:MAG: NMD3-related protein [Promethearchaeota archaeon]